jgi:hypothetical protein
MASNFAPMIERPSNGKAMASSNSLIAEENIQFC